MEKWEKKQQKELKQVGKSKQNKNKNSMKTSFDNASEKN